MSKIRAKKSQSNWKCAQNWPLRCLLRTEECWTHNLLYTVCVLIISICATWFISLLECHLSCYILWRCQMITLMSTWYANKYLAFSFLTILYFTCQENMENISLQVKYQNPLKKSLENVSYFKLTNSGCKLTLQ